MATFIAPPSGGDDFKKLEPGTYTARCYQLIQLGTHEEEFEGVKKNAFKLWIGFEFPTEKEVFKEGGQPEPYTMGREFKFSMFETAGLRKFLEQWRGQQFTEAEAKTFDVGKLLSVPCFLNVTSYTKKNGGTGVKIGSISPMMKGLVCPDQVNPTMAFSLSKGEYDQATFDALPKFLQEKIKLSPEYAALFQTAPTPPPAPPVAPAAQPAFGTPIPADAPLPF